MFGFEGQLPAFVLADKNAPAADRVDIEFFFLIDADEGFSYSITVGLNAALGVDVEILPLAYAAEHPLDLRADAIAVFPNFQFPHGFDIHAVVDGAVDRPIGAERAASRLRGQAGLAAGYFLAQQGENFLILDSALRSGDAWRGRWDSLRLFASEVMPRFSGASRKAAVSA